nr:MAG TPA_asm: prohead serine protease [Caudoviricetes sp.]
METKKYDAKKAFEISDFKTAEEGGRIIISGYANTKYVADRYGDIPQEYNRDFVYELTQYKKNPILLLDHYADTSCLIGKCLEIYEDDRGLYFKAVLTESDLPQIKHAKTLIKEGILKTLSIGGRWRYEDPQDEHKLTLATIYEISLVCVPADPNAMLHNIAQEPKAAPSTWQSQKSGEKITAVNNRLRLFGINQKIDLAVKK